MSAVLLLNLLNLLLGSANAGGAAPRPCDIYASAGTPCVAAHSTTRALFAAGAPQPLFQLRRKPDGMSKNITADALGYADAVAQEAFCVGR